MKKSILFAMILIVGSITGFIIGAIYVNQEKDAIMITESVLYGDKSVAEGIVFRIGVHESGHLIWDTKYQVDSEGGVCDTDFRFSTESVNEMYIPAELFWHKAEEPIKFIHEEFSTYVNMETYFTFTEGSTDNSASGAAEKSYMGDCFFARAVLAVVKKTAPGSINTQEVALADYYSYYPLQIWLEYELCNNISLKGNFGRMEGYNITNFLQIPVRQDHKINVTVEKTQDGDLKTVDVTHDWPIALHSVQVSMEDGCYFAFYCAGRDGELLPCESKIGNGIFRVPVTMEGDTAVLWYDKIEKVYSLPEDYHVMELRREENKDELAIVARTNDAWQMDVLNIREGTIKEGKAFSTEPGSMYAEMREGSNRVFLLFDEMDFCLLKKEDGYYVPELFGAIDGYDGFADIMPDVAKAYQEGALHYEIAYQDGRLAVLLGDYFHSNLMLQVFDATGLQFAGVYRHSAEELISNGYGYLQQWRNNGFEVSFQE